MMTAPAQNDGRRCPASPGPVKADETLALGLYSPELIDKVTRKITKEALRSDYLSKQVHHDECGRSSGLSVARVESAIGVEELKKTIVEIASKPIGADKKREAFGHATIKVLWLQKRALSVLDDGMDSFTSHAIVRSEFTRSQIKRVRDEMIEELNKTLVTWS
ncbi:hypothetical protein GFM13_19170 [Rhizobium leguminosarum bv. viciae]|nr:hypothetical protein [Rhizobium leguminosarum bv. viciae]